MRRFQDPGLFNDPLTHALIAAGYVPLGLHGVYLAASYLIDPVTFGPWLALNAFLGTAVAGGVFAVAVAARRGRLIATIEGTGQLVTAPSAAKMEIEAPARANRFAYAPAIAVGSLVAVLLTAKW